MALEAKPQSIFTWNYRVFDGPREVGGIGYRVFGESGSITAEGKQFQIDRQGPVSGEWRLMTADGSELATARKPSVFTRQMVMQWSGNARTITMQGAHPWTRQMIIQAGDQQIGTISPHHPFTRKARLDFPEEVPLEVQLFCLWLAALLWRRSSNSNS